MREKTAENQRKKARLILLGAALLLAVLLLIPRLVGKTEKNAESAENRLAFLASLGWEADPESEETRPVTIPDCGEGAMASYNELVKRGGYDLSAFQGQTVDMFQYRLLNYPGTEQTVYATLYVSDGRVIGGDIHSAALDGFIHELRARE